MRSTNRFGLLALVVVLSLASAPWSESLAAPLFRVEEPNELTFDPVEARFVRLKIEKSFDNQPCLDELEVYGDSDDENLALASRGAKASASSCIEGYPIHQIAHLNDGQYGNDHSWIAAGLTNEWAQIELPQPARVSRVVFSRDRKGGYFDRLPRVVAVEVSMDGTNWQQVCRVAGRPARHPRHGGYQPPVTLPTDATYDQIVRYALLCERHTWKTLWPNDHLSPLTVERPALPGGEPYWGRIARLEPIERVLVLMEEMADRLQRKGLDVSAERAELANLRRRQEGASADEEAAEPLYLDARLAKRRLMLRDPDLASLTSVLFAQRYPYWASHNYSDVLDSRFDPGGGIARLDIPRRDGRLVPEEAEVQVLFDASEGIARDPMPSFDASRIYFAYRPSEAPDSLEKPYWHLWVMDADGGNARQISHGPFHDYFPQPLPDGGLSFISTRCRARFLCWRPQAFVLFRMEADGSDIRPLSFANLSEWTPSMMRDGRILWTRSEYLDKGANFGHTLWAIRPDGTHPELIFGNNTINCYMNAHEVPGTRELVCTLVSHGGDHNGPIGLIDLGKGPFSSGAITSITPDVPPQYDMSWLRYECFRDPIPVSSDYFLVSHAPADVFGIYVIDRYGNRELIHFDPIIDSMRPRPFRPVDPPPVLRPREGSPDARMGQLVLSDVYRGLSPTVARGKVKYIRVCEEVRSHLDELPTGEYRDDHGPVFQDFYATPVHKVHGPHGWPSYVAKASLGLAPVEEDGSANFLAPAGKVLYFQALDEDFNELQRMRSVMQLQPGERRACIGCHEHRRSAPPKRPGIASLRAPDRLDTPPWGDQAFSYPDVVQPVLDRQCVSCHDASEPNGINLTGVLDHEKVPASYRSLIQGGWVHYFDWGYAVRHSKAEPMSFGTVKSRLWEVLNKGHHGVKLSPEDVRRLKCWIDLNCPLWPDYQYRPDRPVLDHSTAARQ